VDACDRDLTARAALRGLLRGFGDLERLANRILQGIALPRELLALKAALERLGELRDRVAALRDESAVPGAAAVYPLNGDGLAPSQEAIALIARAIVDDPPATTANGGVIRPGYSAELDEIEATVARAKQWIAGLEAVERERSGIRNLKVGYNQVFGYYLEVTKSNAERVPSDYVRKQTLVNAERYITPELKEQEALVLSAAERTQALEGQLYADLLAQLGAMSATLLASARAVAHLDVFLALADLAAECGYVRPELADDQRIAIVGGRHPVVERSLANGEFTPNDAELAPEKAIHIVTGPDMSGKSTYLRQVALIALLAQIGSFVPAQSAHIGLVDRIFARVGAQDEIAAGQSTFMVEMVELANILHHATPRSLLILDEIGRGTSTYDGISIAWAVVEHLHNHPRLGPKTLFATHYHELVELASFLPKVANYNVAVVSQGNQVVFTHRIVPGGADRSYGIHVAQMAGLPAAVIHRAEELLKEMEAAAQRVPVGSGQRTVFVKQLPLFGAEEHPVIAELRALDVSVLSPLEAINKLYELQHKAR
jgi:DNA mismatch repair protein MutS